MIDPGFASIAIGLGALGGLSLAVAGSVALMRSRRLVFSVHTLAGLSLLALSLAIGAIVVGTQGYRPLTYESIAAHLVVRPLGPQRFEATVRRPDGGESRHELAGDEIHVDAHILEWKPWTNLVGLHTSYELDRIAGRHHDAQERAAERSVHALSVDKPWNLFDLRRWHAWLAPLVDARYGSASFVTAAQPAELELLVTRNGLLIRERSAR